MYVSKGGAIPNSGSWQLEGQCFNTQLTRATEAPMKVDESSGPAFISPSSAFTLEAIKLFPMCYTLGQGGAQKPREVGGAPKHGEVGGA